jgi:hypothetical protein
MKRIRGRTEDGPPSYAFSGIAIHSRTHGKDEPTRRQNQDIRAACERFQSALIATISTSPPATMAVSPAPLPNNALATGET